MQLQDFHQQKGKINIFQPFLYSGIQVYACFCVRWGKVVLNWTAKHFLDREFRFNMWRKFVLNSLEVHLLALNNTILSSCWIATRKVMFCRERKWNSLCICISLHLSPSGLFMENQKKTVFKMASRLKKLGWEHLYLHIWKSCLLACSCWVPRNTRKKQITLVPLCFRSSFVCITLGLCQRLIIC